MAITYTRKIPDNMNPWECSVNGKKYVYPAGTVQQVDAEVAEIIDQTADFPAAAPEAKPPFSAGSERLDIVWTFVGVNEIESNVTYDQVEIAFLNKLPISLGVYKNKYFYNLIITHAKKINGGSFIFEIANIDTNYSSPAIHTYEYELSIDGTWSEYGAAD